MPSNLSTPLTPATVRKFFKTLPDPRRRRKRILHPLFNLVFICLCAMLAGADDWEEIAEFARHRREWFAKYLNLSVGIPSHDTFQRVMSALDPLAFQKCLLSWITALHAVTKGQIIAIDGKVAQEAMARAGTKGPLCLVSAWATANRVVLAQVAAAAGSNELGALPGLLKLLDLKQAVVTLDALGCQTHIVEQIIDGGGDYVISVKGNQPKLEKAVEAEFSRVAATDAPMAQHATAGQRNGREETRIYAVLPVPEDFPERHRWKELRSLVMAWREYADADGNYHSGTRHYISSLEPKAKQLADAVRSHWKVENQLAWTLDVAFHEDRSRAREENAQANLGMLRRTALSLIKNTTDLGGSIAKRRKRAGWNTDTLECILFAGKMAEV